MEAVTHRVGRVHPDDLDPELRALLDRLRRATTERIDLWRTRDGRLVTVRREAPQGA